jgi:DNA-binding NarL/FixJ family response regulator
VVAVVDDQRSGAERRNQAERRPDPRVPDDRRERRVGRRAEQQHQPQQRTEQPAGPFRRVGLMAEGLGNTAIAERLFVTDGAVLRYLDGGQR